eukprot:CAMPEP_0197294900 /NCGR_PEP_ID=MMETSP0890-20130614/33852_1 /TAXON_ID=44058 ORGANISM="Aureoumbra lagunensis, Strain CCMP1510" /NCGR_SAMPLE_ID=MMETSP0890 /ASSEMBLY_ACC=CAM_ASM_000533 /LENGTH=728 /DNA_ID=CAMNT_0042770577 /DNA_START=77 /DNA_END=2263 /DNA_ORIENTATION=+
MNAEKNQEKMKKSVSEEMCKSTRTTRIEEEYDAEWCGSRKNKTFRIIVVVLSLGTVMATSVICIMLSIDSVQTTRSTYHTLNALGKFHALQCRGTNQVRSWTLVGAAAEDEALVNKSLQQITKFTDKQEFDYSDFQKSYAREKRKSPKLKQIQDKLRDYDKAFDSYIDYQRAIPYNSQTLVKSTSSFDEYWNEFYPLYKDVAISHREAFNKANNRITVEMKRISQSSGKSILYVALAQSVLTLFAFGALINVLISTRKEHKFKLKCQDMLVRQQAHELRNKYGPAIFVLGQLLDTAQSPNPQLSDILQLAPECNGALRLLQEVESQHQARLDIYRILRGNYKPSPETFDIITMLCERVEAERLIDLSQNHNLADKPVDYYVQVPECYGNFHEQKKEEETENGWDEYENEIQVRTDLYILKHIVQNLTANARKFTFNGSIVVSFLGTKSSSNGDLLVFSVEDTGTGLPPLVLENIFKTNDGCITGDNRGSGLGLPSCAVFCKAANGYIKVKETHRQDDKGNGGMTKIEFAVRGTVISKSFPADTSKLVRVGKSLDDHPIEQPISLLPKQETTYQEDSSTTKKIPLVVIDDSEVNRKCIVRSLQKISSLLNITWYPIDQFETIEAACFRIEQLHASKTFAIISLDQNLESRGGQLTGTDAIKWLINELNFFGLIISASGDPLAAGDHLKLGAHIAWCKPLPKKDKIYQDVYNALQNLGIIVSSSSSAVLP